MRLLAALTAVDESKVTPGLLGFAVIALLGVATYLLIRSMNRQIRNIDLPDEREEPAGEQRPRDGESRPGDEPRGA